MQNVNAEFFSFETPESNLKDFGEVREWLNRAVSKIVVPLRVPWVRIPPSPPFNFLITFLGRVQERLNWLHWKCSEPQKGSVGSNPTLSAINFNLSSKFGIFMASGSAQGLSCELR